MTESEVVVGVLYDGNKTGHTIVQAIESLGHDAHVLSTDQVGVEMATDGVTVTPDVDVLVNWRVPDYDAFSFATHECLRAIEQAIPVVNPSEGVTAASSKLSSTAILNDAGVPVPRTYYSPSLRNLAEWRGSEDTIVQKPLFNGCGTDVMKREGDDSVTMLPYEQEGLLQSPIETPGSQHWDVRAYVVDGEVVTAMKRTADEHEWLTNISQGGCGDVFELNQPEADIAVKATDALGLDAAGVDLICDTDGEWYVLEVNAPAGVRGITDETGINPAAHIAALAIRRGGGEVQDAHATALAEQLGYITDSDEWDNRGTPATPSFRMRIESDGNCRVVGHEVTSVSATMNPERDRSLFRASILDTCTVKIVDVEPTDIGGVVQTRPIAQVTLTKDEIARTVTGVIVEDENTALEADVILAPGSTSPSLSEDSP